MMSAIMSIVNVTVIELAFVAIRYIFIYNLCSRFLMHIPSTLQADIEIFFPASHPSNQILFSPSSRFTARSTVDIVSSRSL